MIDVSLLPNPYDFANPVSDPELFIGRKQQLQEIRYYLDHAKSAARPINLAILGHRASGKTSLLNMAALEAQERGFCVVRVDLDEDDAKHQLAFFFKLFDAILAAACELGGFGGINSKTYDLYLDIVNSFTIPEDKTFCPFLFPIQYAKAMGAKNLAAPITDHNYRGDLQRVAEQLHRPIIILFDESNVLANSRIHLEKLRNIFMNTPGYMLVLTGTPSLFPIIDEVFSPIVRQFKKIEVKPFTGKDETALCIRRPLEKIGIKQVTEIFDSETLRDVREIHSLSGGRPYEIQLICHLLFRRLQEKRAKRMRLTFSVLEDVRKELETSQDISIRPLLAKIKSCTKEELDALHLLCSCEGHGTLDQVWAIHYTFVDEGVWTKERLQGHLSRFIESGVISLRDGKICFAGDYFDRVYIKYFARESSAWVDITSTSLEDEVDFRFYVFTSDFVGLESFESSVKDPLDLEAAAAMMSKNDPEIDIFEEGPRYMEDLYFFMFHNRNRKMGHILRATIEFPWGSQSFYFVTNDADENAIKEAAGALEVMKARASTVGTNLIADIRSIPIVDLKTLVSQVQKTANQVMRNAIARAHVRNILDEYIVNTDTETALMHAEIALQYRVDLSPTEANNLGYLFMVNDDLEKAKVLFELANGGESTDLAPLVSYNKAIFMARNGEIEEAIREIDRCLALCNEENAETECACLMTIRKEAGQLHFEEERMVEDTDEESEASEDDSEDDESAVFVNIREAAESAKLCLLELGTDK
jgi:hypothetical protein